MTVTEAIALVEAAGAIFRLDGHGVGVWYPDEERRRELSDHVAFLREHRREVTEFLKTRRLIPAMPPGVRLIEWNLKPPIAIESCAVVTDPALFAKAAIGELHERLINPKRKYGWSVTQLIDHLAQVGVRITLDSGIASEKLAERVP